MTTPDTQVFARCLYVTTRLPEAAAEHGADPGDGLLLETATGRFVVNGDARRVWASVDGARTVDEIASRVAQETNSDPGKTAESVAAFCASLHELGLLEPVQAAQSHNA